MATATHTDLCRDPKLWAWERKSRPHPDCPGCLPESDRRLFAQLAGEIDSYLAGDLETVSALTADDVPLWGGCDRDPT